jgi:hypothetical protein
MYEKVVERGLNVAQAYLIAIVTWNPLFVHAQSQDLSTLLGYIKIHLLFSLGGDDSCSPGSEKWTCSLPTAAVGTAK